jgi:hypothetical protein
MPDHDAAPRRQLIIDAETTSLEPDYATRRGGIWELAVIERDSGTEHLWRMLPDLTAADPAALAVGQYYERTAGMTGGVPGGVYDLTEPGSSGWSDPAALAAFLAPVLAGATLIAAVPSFDATKFLAAFLARYGQCREPWHYRLRDIGSMSYGYLQACIRLGVEGRDGAMGRPVMDAGTDDFARALNVDPGQFDRHSALGDCRLVAAMLDVIEGTLAGGAL